MAEETQATLTGHSYDEIWTAALTVADEHFEIRERDKTRGVITAERVGRGTPNSWSWAPGARVGIYIAPPATNANEYTIEVVWLPYSPLGQNWGAKVLRDMQRVLAGQPIR